MHEGSTCDHCRAPSLPRTLVWLSTFPTRTDCIDRGQITRMDFLKSRRAEDQAGTGHLTRFLCAHSRVDAHGHHVGVVCDTRWATDAADESCTSTTPPATPVSRTLHEAVLRSGQRHRVRTQPAGQRHYLQRLRSTSAAVVRGSTPRSRQNGGDGRLPGGVRDIYRWKPPRRLA